MIVKISKKYLYGILSVQVLAMLIAAVVYLLVGDEYINSNHILPTRVFAVLILFVFIYQLVRAIKVHKKDHLTIGDAGIEYTEGLKTIRIKKSDIKNIKHSSLFGFQMWDIYLKDGQKISLSKFQITEKEKSKINELF